MTMAIKIIYVKSVLTRAVNIKLKYQNCNLSTLFVIVLRALGLAPVPDTATFTL